MERVERATHRSRRELRSRSSRLAAAPAGAAAPPPAATARSRAGALLFALAYALVALWSGVPAVASAAEPAIQAAKVPVSEALTIPAEALLADGATSRLGMVVTDSPAASRAGARMLESGGNAVDAAVAAAFALGVSLPGSSGLGGQTVMLVRLASGRMLVVDGSARAPLRSSAQVLQHLRNDAQYTTSFYSHKAVATPGTLAALVHALDRYGTKSFAEAVAPAIELAEYGTTWSPAHHAFIEKYVAKMWESDYLRHLFMRDGATVWDPSHVYCNSDLASFLRRLVELGPDAFYRGEIAVEIEREMIAGGGWMRRADLALVQAREVEPLLGRYRGLEVASVPFPGGGANLVAALGILDHFPPELLGGNSVDRLHVVVEACRIAAADAFPYRRPLRPPDEVAVDPAWLARRARLIRLDRALTAEEIGAGPTSQVVVEGTTQVSVVDGAGTMVSLTQTLGATFGAGVAVPGFGFALNNLLNGYEFSDPRAWAYIAPLQANLHCMAPALVLRDGAPVLVIGGAGSSRITPSLVEVLVRLYDGGCTLREAVAAPRALWGGNQDRQIYLEIVSTLSEQHADALRARGFGEQARMAYPTSALLATDFGGVNAILIDPETGTLSGIGDPRRQGTALAPDSGSTVRAGTVGATAP